MQIGISLLDNAVILAMFIHVAICPYSKVEESFNLQATHDILYHGTDLDKYDHHEFSGVVPRTFLGPLFVSAAAYPYILIAKSLQHEKFISQLIVRSLLGLILCYCYGIFRQAVGRKFGHGTALWLNLVTITQFHFLFYASRPLPNIFALALALLSLASWLREHHGWFIWTAGCGIIVFRVELALLLGPILLVELIQRRLSIIRFLLHAVPAGIFWLCLTVAVDSYFWRRWLWPEGDVLWFNTILNKSSDWGTSPYLWYIYSVLPRALGTSIFLVPIAWWLDRRSRWITIHALLFVLLYSFLPHKELRFIIYVFPMFNTATAMSCNKIWQKCSVSPWRGMLAMCVLSHLVTNLILNSGFTYISSINYPGGHIMHRLHEIEVNNTDVHVHIDVYTAQTGVSRYTQLHDHWRYDKTEGLEPGSKEMKSFTHLFVSASSSDSPQLLHYKDTHTIIDHEEGFSHVALQGRGFPPIKIQTEPKIYLLKKKSIMSSSGGE